MSLPISRYPIPDIKDLPEDLRTTEVWLQIDDVTMQGAAHVARWSRD